MDGTKGDELLRRTYERVNRESPFPSWRATHLVAIKGARGRRGRFITRKRTMSSVMLVVRPRTKACKCWFMDGMEDSER